MLALAAMHIEASLLPVCYPFPLFAAGDLKNCRSAFKLGVGFKWW
jgi:hypothetical protein